MSSDNVQRTPEQLVELIRRQQRGRLKIYLGFAAGVGKTYEMLQEGQRLNARVSTSLSASSRRTVARKPRRKWVTCR